MRPELKFEDQRWSVYEKVKICPALPEHSDNMKYGILFPV